MKELNTNEIQQISLEILKYVHKFCVDNEIHYSLYGGSLIGAIRHNGFIPWDDDVDIVMPRPDYDKFIKLFVDTAEYKLLTPEKGNSSKLYARVCDCGKTEAFVALPWFNEKIGVWIDIFPLDGVPASMREFKERIDELYSLERLSYHVRGTMLKTKDVNTLKQKIKIVLRNLIWGRVKISDVLERHMNLVSQCCFDESEYVGQLTFLVWKYKERIHKDMIQKYEYHRFEDSEFLIFSDYDYILRNYYGNYMQLPPEEKRLPSHSAVQGFLWRE